MNFRCNACFRTFSQHQHLRRHFKNFHSSIGPPPSLASSNVTQKFKCKECCKEFNFRQTLKRHMKNFHTDWSEIICLESNIKQLVTISCSLCPTQFTLRPDLFKHFVQQHNLDIVTDIFEFETLNLFLSWKSELEKNTQSKFVAMKGFSSKKGKTTYFRCNRSGNFTSQSKGLRQLKSQGSCKINGICPACIRVTVCDNGRHVVKFTKTHVGHDTTIKQEYSAFTVNNEEEATKTHVGHNTIKKQEYSAFTVKNEEATVDAKKNKMKDEFNQILENASSLDELDVLDNIMEQTKLFCVRT